ncbi:hypothetical protein [Burkholderia gladioli]|uniref:hypothetical protein n=1 Tax=Burkholderia gladioli TaxID=28095 RepID=UPI001640294F|nr:hypothetical protein [Burkholderia gladioli]
MRLVPVLALAVAALLSACAGSGTSRQSAPVAAPRPPGATGAQLLPPGYVCQDCSMSFIVSAIRPPRHGLMLVRGGFMTPQSMWIMVDYDQQRISRVVTAASRDAAGNFALSPVAGDAAALDSTELAGIRADADDVWAALRTMRSKSATDVTWSLYLLDGGAVRHEFGIGLPGDEAAKLAARIDTVVERRFAH